MPDFFKESHPLTTIAVPMIIPAGARYGVVMTSESSTGGMVTISRIRPNGDRETVVAINLDGDIIVRHEPHRDDPVATWLKACRDKLREEGGVSDPEYRIVDYLLDEYRLHADTGTQLHEQVSDGGGGQV